MSTRGDRRGAAAGHSRSRSEIEGMGFAALGDGVAIHPTAQFFGAGNIHIGSRVRIDCFAVVTAGPGTVRIGHNVHIGAAAHLFGTAGIVVADFANLSSRTSVFSTNDDYTGGHLTNPTVPDEFKQVEEAEVRIGEHAVLGCGSVVLPGVVLGRGAAVGALSLVREPVGDFEVVAGVPARVVGARDRGRLEELAARYERTLE